MPDVFWPERWLPTEIRASLHPPDFEGPEKVVLDKSAFIPFSFGPAMCIGKNLAYEEMRMIVCFLMQTFDMRLADGYEPEQWEKDIQDMFIVHKGSLPVVLSSRIA